MEKTPICSAHFAFDAVSCVVRFSFHAVPKCWKNLGDQMAADLSGTGQNLSFSAQRLYHKRALELIFPYECFAFIFLQESQWCSHTQHSLGAYWKVVVWLLLSREEWVA